MIEPILLEALKMLQRRLDRQPINWAITASCGLALQGVEVPVRDVDLATDRAGAYRIAELFAAEMTRPIRFASTERIQSYYGAFSLGAYEFEVIGDTQFRVEDGAWAEPVEFTAHKHFVRIEGLTLPVLTLEFEYASYLSLGRDAKVALLADYLGKG